MLQLAQALGQIVIVRNQRRKEYDREIQRLAPDLDEERRDLMAKELAHRDYNPYEWGKAIKENAKEIGDTTHSLGKTLAIILAAAYLIWAIVDIFSIGFH